MPMGEVYDGINKGVIEGFVAAYDPLQALKLGEVVKYTVANPRSALSQSAFVVFNKRKWNALSTGNQKVLEQMSKELAEKVPQVWEEGSNDAKNSVVKEGHVVTTSSPNGEERWIESFKPVLDKYVSEMAAKGLPGAEVLSFAQDFLKSHQK